MEEHPQHIHIHLKLNKYEILHAQTFDAAYPLLLEAD